jgi:hypothetical protein
MYIGGAISVAVGLPGSLVVAIALHAIWAYEAAGESSTASASVSLVDIEPSGLNALVDNEREKWRQAQSTGLRTINTSFGNSSECYFFVFNRQDGRRGIRLSRREIAGSRVKVL